MFPENGGTRRRQVFFLGVVAVLVIVGAARAKRKGVYNEGNKKIV